MKTSEPSIPSDGRVGSSLVEADKPTFGPKSLSVNPLWNWIRARQSQSRIWTVELDTSPLAVKAIVVHVLVGIAANLTLATLVQKDPSVKIDRNGKSGQKGLAATNDRKEQFTPKVRVVPNDRLGHHVKKIPTDMNLLTALKDNLARKVLLALLVQTVQTDQGRIVVTDHQEPTEPTNRLGQRVPIEAKDLLVPNVPIGPSDRKRPIGRTDLPVPRGLPVPRDPPVPKGQHEWIGQHERIGQHEPKGQQVLIDRHVQIDQRVRKAQRDPQLMTVPLDPNAQPRHELNAEPVTRARSDGQAHPILRLRKNHPVLARAFMTMTPSVL